MGLLCEVRYFREALLHASQLLSEEELRQRGLERIPAKVHNCRDFLAELYKREFDTYAELIEVLQGFDKTDMVAQMAGAFGKLMDVIQILKLIDL